VLEPQEKSEAGTPEIVKNGEADPIPLGAGNMKDFAKVRSPQLPGAQGAARTRSISKEPVRSHDLCESSKVILSITA